jgi:hypothetical protein
MGSPTQRALARARDRYRKSNDQYYTWFTVLVALCEPALLDPHGVAPTNQQLARRTGFRVADVQRKLAFAYAALEVGAAKRPRDVTIRRAIETGVVTRAHLSLLPSRRA